MNIRFQVPAGPRLAKGPAWWASLAAAGALLAAQTGAALYGAVVFLDRLGDLCRGASACDPWPRLGDFWAATLAVSLLSLSFPIIGALWSLVRALWRRRFWASWAARIGGWIAAILGLVALIITDWALAWAIPGLVLAVAARRIGFEGPARTPEARKPAGDVIEGEVVD